MAERESVAQLRREARKARALGDAAFGEAERKRFFEIAASLDREAHRIEAGSTAQARWPSP